MEDNVPGVTVRVVVPVMDPKVAVMVVLPAATPVARPVALIVAIVGVDEFQATWEVRSWVVESENVPVATNCWVSCMIKFASVGATAMEDSVADDTVRVVFPEMPPMVAVMVVGPTATGVARPLLLIVATAVFDEFQVTSEVTSWEVLSE